MLVFKNYSGSKRTHFKYRCILKAKSFYEIYGDLYLPRRWLHDLLGDTNTDFRWNRYRELCIETDDMDVVIKLSLTPRELWKHYRISHPNWVNKGMSWVQERKSS